VQPRALCRSLRRRPAAERNAGGRGTLPRRQLLSPTNWRNRPQTVIGPSRKRSSKLTEADVETAEMSLQRQSQEVPTSISIVPPSPRPHPRGVSSSRPFRPDWDWRPRIVGARDRARAASPGRTVAAMRTDASTEKPPPCARCPMEFESSSAKGLRRTNPRTSGSIGRATDHGQSRTRSRPHSIIRSARSMTE
jgi:hypothetical protein